MSEATLHLGFAQSLRGGWGLKFEVSGLGFGVWGLSFGI